MAAIQQNQLLFNLDVPTMPINMAAQYSRPEAIVIEKFGTYSGPVISPPKQVFHLSAVSEESLSQAVQLAKRDLKKQKELTASEKNHKAVGKMTIKRDGRKGNTEIIRSSSYNERLRKREERKKQERNRVLLMKEREKGWKARTMTTQTGSLNNEKPSRRMLSEMPVSSMSPPTRDVGSDLTHLSGDARTLAEIRKLRIDMEACLKKIHEIHEAAKRDPSAWRPVALVYAEDIEAERKRVQRREEQETRSLRTIYQLTQQVRVLQEEINHIGPANMKHDKKSQILSRLAAIHRGTIRALQTFIQHITDYDISQGLPRSYHELGLLLRQLSLCCVQLEVAGEPQVPDSVMTLLKDYAEINKILDITTSPKSPPRLCQIPKTAQNNKKSSPANRKLDFNVVSDLTKPGDQFETKHKTTQGPIVIDKVEKHRTERDATSDRQAALRSAVSSLLRDANTASGSAVLPKQHKSLVPRLELPPTTRTLKGVAWEYPLEKPKLQQFKAGHRKGLLLPAKLRDQRRKVPKTQVVVPCDTHYAEPTLSSRLKEVPPEERIISRSPQQSRRQQYLDVTGIGKKRAVSAPASPRSPGLQSMSPSSPFYSSPDSPTTCGSPRSPGERRDYLNQSSPFSSSSIRGDIIRQVQMERENKLKRTEKAKISRLRQELGQPEEWVRKVEEKLRKRLQPLLDQAQVDINADLLADSLLGELLEDTAQEFRDIDIDTQAEHRAAVMLNMPSVETMVQRLQEMEKEQQQIRRRWATLVYEDENRTMPPAAGFSDAPLSEQPYTPTPIHVTSRLPDIQQTFLPDSVLARLESHPADERAILFTKPVQQIELKSSLHFSHGDGTIHIKPEAVQTKQGIHVTLTGEMIQSIESHKKTYEQYLKKNSYQAIGHFNPWHIVEEVASEILDDCLSDVARELEDFNNDIVNKVYSGEFNKVPSPASSKPASSPHPNSGTALTTTKEKIRTETRPGEVSPSLRKRGDTLNLGGHSPSPGSVSGNYSYEDDFVESSARSRSPDSDSKSVK